MPSSFAYCFGVVWTGVTGVVRVSNLQVFLVKKNKKKKCDLNPLYRRTLFCRLHNANNLPYVGVLLPSLE